MRKPARPVAPASRPARDNRVRIIGGRWRGRKLHFPDGAGLRPTGDRIRETLFNWLQPVLPDAHCLDLFAGSGALGFEALSRGAASCVMVEQNPQALQCLQQARQLLGADNAAIKHADSRIWLTSATGAFDIVFIDPPFADPSLVPATLVTLLLQRQLLSRDALVYIEQPADREPYLPAGFVQYRQQRAGQISYSLWRHAENTL